MFCWHTQKSPQTRVLHCEKNGEAKMLAWQLAPLVPSSLILKMALKTCENLWNLVVFVLDIKQPSCFWGVAQRHVAKSNYKFIFEPFVTSLYGKSYLPYTNDVTKSLKMNMSLLLATCLWSIARPPPSKQKRAPFRKSHFFHHQKVERSFLAPK